MIASAAIPRFPSKRPQQEDRSLDGTQGQQRNGGLNAILKGLSVWHVVIAGAAVTGFLMQNSEFQARMTAFEQVTEAKIAKLEHAIQQETRATQPVFVELAKLDTKVSHLADSVEKLTDKVDQLIQHKE